MELKNTTPVPNGIFEQMKMLSGTELKALLMITRNTLGWKDQLTGKRKQRDWIAHRQFVERAGISDRSVTSAIQGLIDKRLIEATDRNNHPMDQPKDRQKCPQVFYGLIVKNQADSTDTPAKISQNRQNPPQSLRTTKEILQNSSQHKLPQYPQRELIEREHYRKQEQRNGWRY